MAEDTKGILKSIRGSLESAKRFVQNGNLGAAANALSGTVALAENLRWDIQNNLVPSLAEAKNLVGAMKDAKTIIKELETGMGLIDKALKNLK